MARIKAVFLVLLAVYTGCTYGMNMNTTVVILSKYGYLPEGTKVETMDMEVLTEAISKFQKVADMPVTGTMDEATEQMMHMPRCGMSDANIESSAYQIRGQWSKRHLTYRVFEYTEKMRRDQVDRELAKAFASWSTYSPLTFARSGSGPVDLEIRFNSRGRAGNPFDGPGGTLAYAFFPQYGGDIYFDDSEPWVEGTNGGTSLYHVAVHEIGHSLGLDHSMVRQAIMYPFYWTGFQNLLGDDVEGIQRIYGQRTINKRRRFNFRTFG